MGNAMRNIILQYYNEFKLALNTDDMARLVGPHAERLCAQVPASLCLEERCRAVATARVIDAFIRAGRPLESVGKLERDGAIEITTSILHSILLSGRQKTIYCMRKDAVEFVNATAFTQKLTREFFKDYLSTPVVVYANNDQTLFENITTILMNYDQEIDEVTCIWSVPESGGGSREIGLTKTPEELCGVLAKEIVAEGLTGETSRFLVAQGFFSERDELDAWMYEAMSFIFKFLLLKQTEKQPLEVARQYKKFKDEEKERKVRGYVTQQVVSLTTRYKIAMDRCRTDSEVVELDKEGKVQKLTPVVGFLRRQHYGPNNSLIKTVFIEPHERQAWVNEGLRIIKVTR